MAETPDWRLQNQEKYLKGAVLFRRRYHRRNPALHRMGFRRNFELIVRQNICAVRF